MENKPADIGNEGEILFCGKCGNKLSQGVAFCEMCGAPIHRAAQPVQAPAAQQPEQAPAAQQQPAQTLAAQPAQPWQPSAPPWQPSAPSWQQQAWRQPAPAAPYAAVPAQAIESGRGMPRWLVVLLGALSGIALAGLLIWLYIALI